MFDVQAIQNEGYKVLRLGEKILEEKVAEV